MRPRIRAFYSEALTFPHAAHRYQHRGLRSRFQYGSTPRTQRASQQLYSATPRGSTQGNTAQHRRQRALLYRQPCCGCDCDRRLQFLHPVPSPLPPRRDGPPFTVRTVRPSTPRIDARVPSVVSTRSWLSSNVWPRLSTRRLRLTTELLMLTSRVVDV